MEGVDIDSPEHNFIENVIQICILEIIVIMIMRNG